MADFNRTVTYTDADDLISKISSFLQTTGPGPSWEEEGTYSGTGQSFVRSAAGSDVVYLHIHSDGADPDMVFVDYVKDDATMNGWDAGTGPAATFFISNVETNGTGLYVGGDGGSATMIASEDRFIILVTAANRGYHTVCYGGIYEPHTDPSNDTYPNVVATNSTALNTLDPSALGELDLKLPANSFLRRRMLGFPGSVLKSDKDSLLRVYNLVKDDDGQLVETIPHRGQYIPTDDRESPAQVFIYELYVVFTENGKGESIFLTGSYRCSELLTVGSTITVGVDDYLVWPSNPDNPPGGPLLMLGPLGTGI